MLEFINELSESKSFRSKDILGKMDDQRSRDLLFAHIAVLMSLIQDDKYKDDVVRYLSKSIAYNNFDFFRNSGNDLYMLIYKQHEYKYFDERELIRFSQNVIMGNYSFIYTYLNKLYTSLSVKNSVFIRFKRYAAYWNRVGDAEKRRALELALVDIRKDMPNSELYHLVRRRA